jgi:hypothetical protein
MPSVPALQLFGGGVGYLYRERFVPANLAIQIVLVHVPLLTPDEVIPVPFDVFKNGLLMDPTTDFTLAGSTITLSVAANGTDVYQVIYVFQVA